MRRHFRADGCAGREEEIGNDDVVLYIAIINKRPVLIDQLEIGNAMFSGPAFDIIGNKSWVQLRRMIDRKNVAGLQDLPSYGDSDGGDNQENDRSKE